MIKRLNKKGLSKEILNNKNYSSLKDSIKECFCPNKFYLMNLM